MKLEFEKTYEGDAVFYWYDITEYMKQIFGDILSKALICIGQGYNDDSEMEIWRLENKLECNVREVQRKLTDTLSYYFDYSQDIKLYFNNGNVVNLGSPDGFSVEKGV